MNRYLAALIVLLGLSTLYGVTNPPGFFSSETVDSVETPATPAAVTTVNAVGLESAGNNVLRQTSPLGLERLAAIQNSGVQPVPATTPTTTPVEPEPAPAPAPQVIPENPPQEPIPALW